MKHKLLLTMLYLVVLTTVIYFVVWLRSTNQAVVTIQNRSWFREVKVFKIGVEQETTSWFTTRGGVITKQWTEPALVSRINAEGNLELRVESKTHYLYRPWVEVHSVRIETGEVKWPTVPYEQDVETKFVKHEGYWVEFDNTKVESSHQQYETASVGDQFEVEWAYGILLNIRPHLSEVVPDSAFDY